MSRRSRQAAEAEGASAAAHGAADSLSSPAGATQPLAHQLHRPRVAGAGAAVLILEDRPEPDPRWDRGGVVDGLGPELRPELPALQAEAAEEAGRVQHTLTAVGVAGGTREPRPHTCAAGWSRMTPPTRRLNHHRSTRLAKRNSRGCWKDARCCRPVVVADWAQYVARHRAASVASPPHRAPAARRPSVAHWCCHYR